MVKNFFYLFIFILLISSVNFARPGRVAQIPNGSINSCANCHVNPAGGGARNLFGKLVEQKFLTVVNSSGKVKWGPVLASLDADGDGVTNGEELQDPYGLWKEGDSNPGNSALVTSPAGFAHSPAFAIDIIFDGMTPHSGQLFGLRVIDKMSFKEVTRKVLQSASGQMSLSLEGILPGHKYWIDFFADHNGNGLYDSPPTDHAWRLELNNPAIGDTILFSHNTEFTEINWTYLLTIAFTGMNPHIGQLIELRVEDDITGLEVGRERIESIVDGTFNIRIPGVKPGVEYNIEFYSDHNGNKTYDSPPTDHAWEIKFENTTGDTIIEFSHNTNFTDVNWKYLLQFNLFAMTPHLGQEFSARVINSNNEEVGRIVVPSVPDADFSVELPGVELSHDYTLDFFADHNGNKKYDAPPADHAYRLLFNSGSDGNFVLNFAHNTNFTDINWPGTVEVEKENSVITDYNLSQNFPNPFNPVTNIKFSLKQGGFTTLIIYNILGKEIFSLIEKDLPAGEYNVDWNAANLESGVYLYKIKSGNFIETKKMLLLK